MEISNKRILITGGASGIGWALPNDSWEQVAE